MVKYRDKEGTVTYYSWSYLIVNALKFLCDVALAVCIVHFIYKYW